MSTLTVRTHAPRSTAPSRFERMLLEGAAALEVLAVRHMDRRTAAADIERRRDESADVRRDAQAAGNLSLLPR